MAVEPFIVGNPVPVVVDIQNGGPPSSNGGRKIPHMENDGSWVTKAAGLVEKCREVKVPIVFILEAHRRELVDFGKELDGQEDAHLLEGDFGIEIRSEIGMKEDDYFIRKRRYSCFFGTDFEILRKGLKAENLLLVGGLTDVCVNYSFVDGHQHNYFCRVVEDCVIGPSLEAHEESLKAMEYLQTGARCSSVKVFKEMDALAG